MVAPSLRQKWVTGNPRWPPHLSIVSSPSQPSRGHGHSTIIAIKTYQIITIIILFLGNFLPFISLLLFIFAQFSLCYAMLYYAMLFKRYNSPSQVVSELYGTPLAIWHHPTQMNSPRLLNLQPDRLLLDLPTPEGWNWFDLGDWLIHAEMVYPHTDGHPPKY